MLENQEYLKKLITYKRYLNYQRLYDISEGDHLALWTMITIYYILENDKDVDTDYIIDKIIENFLITCETTVLSAKIKKFLEKETEYNNYIENIKKGINKDFKLNTNAENNKEEDKILKFAKEQTVELEIRENLDFFSINKNYFARYRTEIINEKLFYSYKSLIFLNRWNNIPRKFPVSVAVHSFFVLFLFRMNYYNEIKDLNNKEKTEIYGRIIYHDLIEHLTGDVITPIKKIKIVGEIIEKTEKIAYDYYIKEESIREMVLEPFGGKFGKEMKECDKLSAETEVLLEKEEGNIDFKHI